MKFNQQNFQSKQIWKLNISTIFLKDSEFKLLSYSHEQIKIMLTTDNGIQFIHWNLALMQCMIGKFCADAHFIKF